MAWESTESGILHSSEFPLREICTVILLSTGTYFLKKAITIGNSYFTGRLNAK
jgi:hypothetical protein